MDETTKALVEETRRLADRIAADEPGLGRTLVDKLAALLAAHRPPAVPTEPGAYYLTDGSVGMVEGLPGGSLHEVGGGGYNAVAALTWATDPTTGAVERVPGLEEMRALHTTISMQAGALDLLEAQIAEARARVADLTAKGEEAARLLIEAQQEAERAEAERDEARATVERVRGVLAQLEEAASDVVGRTHEARQVDAWWRNALSLALDPPAWRELRSGPHDHCVVEGAHRREDCRSVPTPQPQRCVDCVHRTGDHGCTVSEAEISSEDGGPISEWIDDHWEDDAAPQPIPCPAFRRREAP